MPLARGRWVLLLNNVAVGIRQALDVHGLERVALVDFDVHHGNGSEDILAGDERVLMVSTFERGLYPSAARSRVAANMANVALAPRSGGAALREAYESVWKPRLEAFAPQMIFVSAGFRCAPLRRDGGLCWVEADYGGSPDGSWKPPSGIAPVAWCHASKAATTSRTSRPAVAAHVRVLAGTG
jgi:hypothetical protein